MPADSEPSPPIQRVDPAPQAKQNAWKGYAGKFAVFVSPPCQIRYDRALVQPGIPTRDTLVFWCSVPIETPDQAPSPEPAVLKLERFQEAGPDHPEDAWVVDSDLTVLPRPQWLAGPLGTGRLELSGLAANSRYRVRLAWGGATLEVQARTAPAADVDADFHILAVSTLEPYGHRQGRDPAVIKMGTANSLRLLERRATDADSPPGFLLGLGGLSNIRPVTGVDTTSPDPSIAADVHHRLAVAIPPVDAALRAVPSAIMWNDHDDPHRAGRVGYQALRNPPPWSLDDGKGFTKNKLVRLQDPAQGASCAFDWGADFRVFMLDPDSKTAVEDLRKWLAEAGDTRNDVFTVLAIGSPVPLFAVRKQKGSPAEGTDQRLLGLIAGHFRDNKQHQLLVLSGGGIGSELVEISDHGGVIGHEVVAPSLTLPRKLPDRGEASKAPVGVGEGLKCRSFGRHPGPGLIEIRLKHEKGKRQVQAVFLPATTLAGWTLANTTEVKHEFQVLARESTAAPKGVGAFFDRFIKKDFRRERAGWKAPGWRGEIVLEDVREAECEEIKKRRERRKNLKGNPSDPPLFGIALSGGGVRSGATSFGFLQELDDRGLFRQADYLSTVSGGGYAGGFFQERMLAHDGKAAGSLSGPHRQRLLPKEDIPELHKKGQYLAPGTGWEAKWWFFRLLAAYLASIPLNLAPWLAWGLCVGTTLAWIGHLIGKVGWGWKLLVADAVALAAVLGVHLLFIPLGGPVGREFRRRLRDVEALLMVAGALFLLIVSALKMSEAPQLIGNWIGKAVPEWKEGIGSALVAFANEMRDSESKGVLFQAVAVTWGLALFTSYFANPNTLSMHGVLKERIVRAFLSSARKKAPDDPLHALAGRKGETPAGPYPLFGGCLTVLGEPDPAFSGANASDYFLLSPLYCGARLTGYASTKWPRYEDVSLGDALACSAASVNTGMGSHSSALLTLLSTLFNLRLGVWMWNPRRPDRAWLWVRFWPYYTWLELTKKADTKRRLISVSDGGFIDNLGVIELLRRRCKVILAIDNTYDPDYRFQHLRNLIVRAKQELGLEIKNDQALDRLRPSLITGLSGQQFTVFDIRSDPRRTDPEYRAILIYAKASVSQRPSYLGRSAEKSKADAYRTYNPKFPQDTTVDQFFDQPQWDAYFELGTEIAKGVTEDPNVFTALKRLDEPMPELVKLFAAHQRPPAPKRPIVPGGNP